MFSSSANANFNPAVPITCGYIVGFISSIFNQRLGRIINKGGVVFSLSLIQHIMIPAILGVFLSAVLFGLGETSYNGSTPIGTLIGRLNGDQGAIQMLGGAVSLGIGLLAGIFVGVFYKCHNGN